MYPWDFNKHFNTNHRKCGLCGGYKKDDEHLWEHKQGAGKEKETEPVPEPLQTTGTNSLSGNSRSSNQGHWCKIYLVLEWCGCQAWLRLSSALAKSLDRPPVLSDLSIGS